MASCYRSITKLKCDRSIPNIKLPFNRMSTILLLVASERRGGPRYFRVALFGGLRFELDQPLGAHGMNDGAQFLDTAGEPGQLLRTDLVVF